MEKEDNALKMAVYRWKKDPLVEITYRTKRAFLIRPLPDKALDKLTDEEWQEAIAAALRSRRRL